ncbi:MAG: ABC transporter ATP-binding protein [Clostridia bacterium]|nr:ABC transporter ATP-binding protein [Clostridia bacterium]
MISIKNVTHTYEKETVLENLCSEIKLGSIYGLIGSNGAGKSTLLNVIDGIFKPLSGEVLIDGINTYENPVLKDKIAYVPDDPFFFNSYSMDEMAKYLNQVFESFTMEKYKEIKAHFPLESSKKMNTFSKGMKRQAAIIFALSQSPKLLLCDECFDGLDPVIKQLVKRNIIAEVEKNNMTVIISSHNLREIENLCDVIGILHNKQIILERSIDDIKEVVNKFQVAFENPLPDDAFSEIDIISKQSKGSVTELVTRGNKDLVKAKLNDLKPVILDTLPLSLEDIFIYEMEANGYDFSKILV